LLLGVGIQITEIGTSDFDFIGNLLNWSLNAGLDSILDQSIFSGDDDSNSKIILRVTMKHDLFNEARFDINCLNFIRSNVFSLL